MPDIGKVWLVGAGPGDAGLMTLRGREVLESADAVVFDRLIGGGVLSMIPDGAEAIDAGKSGGNHTMPQREIEALLVRLAKEGKRVVRLKGGDPFVFGRGGEEAAALIENGIPFEIVPGITSAVAVAEYDGIPVTHRGVSSSLHIITAHTRDSLPNAALGSAAMSGGTLVLLMGVENADAAAAKLTESGMCGDTPAAVIERGTTSRRRLFRTVLSDLADCIKRNNITSPAVIVIGKAAALDFGWRSGLPLDGIRAAVTRPRERAGRLSRMLRDAGAEVIELPCIATETLADAVLPPISGADWAVFTSAAGIGSLIALLSREGRDIRELGCAKIAAIGPATAESLRAHGLHVDLMPDVYDGAHLGAALADAGCVNALLLRAEKHGPEPAAALARAGIAFREIPLYRTRFIRHTVPDDLDIALFTSASTAEAFAACVSADWEGFNSVRAVCIGERTADAARSAGFRLITVSKKADLESLAAAALDFAEPIKNER